MRHRLFGLVLVAALAACSDSSPTATRTPPGLDHVRALITPSGTLDQNIQTIIGFWPNGPEHDLLNQWNDLKKKFAKGQTDPKALADAKKKLADLAKHILKLTPKMDGPPTGESPDAAAARLILYMSLYIYGGPDTQPPPFDPGADDAVGFLDPNHDLTIVTPSDRAGAHFDKGSVDGDRIIIITVNPNRYGPCDGPLLTQLCQWPLFYDIQSFPDGPLLKMAKGAICHVNAGDGAPPEGIHNRFRLAHTKPDNPANYTPGGTIRYDGGELENIEILPLISQTFVHCLDVEYDFLPSELVDAGFMRRGAHAARALALRVQRLLSPRSAYAIDQGGGGGFEAFSPFNDVDPGPDFVDAGPPPPPPPPSPPGAPPHG